MNHILSQLSSFRCLKTMMCPPISFVGCNHWIIIEGGCVLEKDGANYTFVVLQALSI